MGRWKRRSTSKIYHNTHHNKEQNKNNDVKDNDSINNYTEENDLPHAKKNDISAVNESNDKKQNGYKKSNDINHSESKDECSSDNSPTKSPKTKIHYYFNSHEKIQIRRYLEDYRDITTNVKSIPSNNEETIMIGGHEFQNIYNPKTNLSYLKLPLTLTNKHRHYLHDICLELNLYHDSYNNEHNKRCMIVSASIDALSNVLPVIEHPVYIPFDICRPWYYQNCHGNITPTKDNRTAQDYSMPRIPCKYVMECTKQSESCIQQYISNPLSCIINNDTILQNDVVSIIKSNLQNEKVIVISNNTLSTALPYDSDTWMYIDTVDKMNQCISEIKELSPNEIGFDLELYNKNKYTCITCLLQLSTREKTYVIDPFATNKSIQTTPSSPPSKEETVWSTIPKLSQFFSNPNIIKIGHCINSMDVPSLHRDFGITIVNAFDTMEAAKVLQLDKAGLAALCHYYKLSPSEDLEYSRLKDLYQRQDWRCRPLEEDMLRYARYDVYYLIKLRECMVRDILMMDGQQERIGMNKDVDGGEVSSLEWKLISKTLARNMSDKGNTNETSSVISSIASDDEGYFTPAEDDEEYYDTLVNTYSNTALTNDITTLSDTIKKYYKQYLKVLQQSQNNCLSFWKHKIEPYAYNETKRDVQKKEGPRWTTSHEYLFNNLIQWRNYVAYNIYNTMPGLLISTELLVYIAYKRPTTYEELRYISFILPQILENDVTCRNEIFSLVQSSFDREYHKVHSTSASSSLLHNRLKKIESEISAKDNSFIESKEDLSKENHEDHDTKKEESINDKKINQTKLLKYSAITLVLAGAVIITMHFSRRRGKR